MSSKYRVFKIPFLTVTMTWFRIQEYQAITACIPSCKADSNCIQLMNTVWKTGKTMHHILCRNAETVTHMVMLGGELCTTISVWISGTMDPGGGTTPPAVSKSTSGACRGGGTWRHNGTHTAQIYIQTDRYGHDSKPKQGGASGRQSQQVFQ